MSSWMFSSISDSSMLRIGRLHWLLDDRFKSSGAHSEIGSIFRSRVLRVGLRPADFGSAARRPFIQFGLGSTSGLNIRLDIRFGVRA